MKAKAIVTRDDGVLEIVEAHRCDAQHHISGVLATQRLSWVTGPVEYCDGCAAWMMRVATVMGVHVHVEVLPPLAESLRARARAISLENL